MAAVGHPGSRQIGQYLIEQGSLREDQVERLLEMQQRDARAGVHSRFGELCVRSGWADASEVTAALRRQQEERILHAGLGDMLVALGFLTPERLEIALEAQLDEFEPLEEVVVEQELCTHEEVRVALQLLSLLRNNAARQPILSNFVPINVMELLVCEQIDEAMRAQPGCLCTQCWGNVFAVALNELPPRYISQHTRLLDCLQRFRSEYDDLVREKLAAAVTKVRANPKAACRSRFSDELLAGGEFDGEVYDVTVNLSNRHVHLCQADIEALFGPGYELTKMRDLLQPGQFAAQETVTLVGEKGSLDRVRVLGPARKQTQVEISGTDQFLLGVRVPVRESGKLEGTPGIGIRGPAGEVQIASGAIRALRHVHMPPKDADRMGLQNGDMVSVRLKGDRTTICEGVLIRVTETSALEMHVDTDEANAAGLPASSVGQILVPAVVV